MSIGWGVPSFSNQNDDFSADKVSPNDGELAENLILERS